MLTIRPAVPADSDNLITLTGLTPMKGVISLRIDRQPDFFALLQQRGEFIALVAETEQGELVGSFTACRQAYLYRQVPTAVYYLGDLKVHPALKGSSLAYRLVARMYQELKDQQADLLLCTAAQGNDDVMPFFDGRMGIPKFQKTGCFLVYQVLPRKSTSGYQALTSAPENLTDFYASTYQPFCLHPTIDQVNGCTHFIQADASGVRAALSLVDTSSSKQNVVLDYPLSVSLLLHALKVIKPFVALPSLPRRNEALRIAYVRYMGMRHGGEADLTALIKQARHWAYDHQYHFVSFTLHEQQQELKKLLQRWQSFLFISQGLVTSLQGNEEQLKDITTSLIYEDFSLV
jgi:GNAT superfamily N-acetyltransferase